jgi:CMP-N,N'-diacetyllegionaminic acid synthase
LSTLAIVPARGGSKSLPRKNVRLLAGKPLICWTLDAASCSSVDRVIVSTDDPEIADVARRAGAEVPFERPAELARDDTPGIAPILHAIGWLDEHEGYRPDVVMMLQPTSPLRTAADIDAALRLLMEHEGDAVVSVCPATHHPYWTRRITPEGLLADFVVMDHVPVRRQDLPQAFALNGAVYAGQTAAVVRAQSFYPGRTHAYVMPPERSVDIDSPWDFELADLILSHRSASVAPQ